MVTTKWRGKNSLRARKIFKPQRLREDSASKTPAIRFKEKARFKDEIAAAEPTSVYAVDEHASHLGTQFNGRTYNRPETHSPRADCARFMPRFRYLRVPPACAGALSAPRQGGSQVVLAVKFCRTERERERETPRQRGTVNPLITGSTGRGTTPGSTSDGHQAKCTKALPACTAGCRPASRW
jgi:hypothetical protein